jgi:5-methylthioadenosine/S-adenosylhomocysteine deaminase
MKPAEVIIFGGRVVLAMSDGDSAPIGWVRISAGLIVDIGLGPPPNIAGHRTVDARGTLVMPGLVNAHTHLEQSLIRGQGDGLSLGAWLDRIIRPAESSMTPTDVHAAALAGLADNLRRGVTEVRQHQKVTTTPDHERAVMEAAEQIGIRLQFVRGWRDNGRYAEDPQTFARALDGLSHCLRPHSRTTLAIGPMAPWRCSDRGMAAITDLARDRGLALHLHIAETIDEVGQVTRERGVRPIEWLDKVSALGEHVDLVHCVHVSPSELDLIAASGSRVVVCPSSNLVLGSGIAPLQDMVRRGIPVAVGSDGAATWTDSPLELARLAQLLARGVTRRADAVAYASALQMATGGRRPRTGLTIGAPADIAVLEITDGREAVGFNDLVIRGQTSRARTVIVGGDILVDDGRVVAFDQSVVTGARTRAGASRPSVQTPVKRPA